ncbi:hypothetical protein ADICYQ_2067 [Cyclobacterium qasimii M12-11B]|uniref:Uncharacterized protein n=1 Tax=Cyclobacterium qasimii M12-11B TaxID=641524 RepID=S7VFA4_9BACT|nr:hypothetical protein ADICYQ_2067 [Cyclobacterium qasimii M12-11B]
MIFWLIFQNRYKYNPYSKINIIARIAIKLLSGYAQIIS